MSWDDRILLFMADQRSEAWDGFFRAVTWLGSLYILVPLAGLLSLTSRYVRQRWEIGLLAMGFGGAALWAYLIKAVLARPRPALVEPLIAMPADRSFPSAHATQIVAFLLCLTLMVRRAWPAGLPAVATAALVLAVTVALSRIYLQVHYPSDVLGGVALGFGWVVLVEKILSHRFFSEAR